MENRLKIGKATALADWKLSYKVFNAWKRINNTEKMQRQHEIHQNQVKYENIKCTHAHNFYKAQLLRKCMNSWSKFSRESITKKKLDEEKAFTKSRMEKFLEAASEGKLWSKDDHNNELIFKDQQVKTFYN